MYDRQSNKPGRVKITPESGTPAYYATLERADEPTVAGTPLNKASLLADATAALFGLGADAVPDDVLAELGKYKQYWWRRRSINSGWYQVDTAETDRLLKDDTHDTVVYTYGDSISVSKTNGTITINSTTSMTLRRSTVTVDKLAVLKGKYFKTDVNQQVSPSNIHIVAGDIYFVPADASITKYHDSDSGSNDYYTSELTHVTTEYRSTIGNWQYVHSSNRNAYPDSGTQDGYEYEYLGIPFDNAVEPGAQIATGSYVGTGTYGQSNPNRIVTGFPVKLLFIAKKDEGLAALDTFWYSSVIWVGGTDGAKIARSDNLCKFISNETGVSWYGALNGPEFQLNVSGSTYFYVAFG